MKKTFVRVECLILEDGIAIPKKIIWNDGREWCITQVLHSNTSSDHEFEGIRYTVLIGSAEKYLYKLGSRWYVDTG